MQALKKLIYIITLLYIMVFYHIELFARSSTIQDVYDAPWYTGPLIAPAAVSVPLGHINFEWYTFSTKDTGFFNKHWQLLHGIAAESLQFTPIMTYGLTDSIDTLWAVPYTLNKDGDAKNQNIGDASILLGIQLIRQRTHKWRPNLRLTVLEVFPTGKFDGLNPVDEGTGASGSGSYQTGITLNFEHLLHIYQEHFLSTRFSIAYVYGAPHGINGYSIYGGNYDTHGKITPGGLETYDLSFELTLTKHIVAVMEGYMFHRSSSSFTGRTGKDIFGNNLALSIGSQDTITLAPALEYNFSDHIGIIGGSWFSIKGKDSPKFNSVVVAINLYW